MWELINYLEADWPEDKSKSLNIETEDVVKEKKSLKMEKARKQRCQIVV